MTSNTAVIYEFDGFLLDPVERNLKRHGATIPLTQKAFETLLVLVSNHGRMVEKQELMETVWHDSFVEESSLTFNIHTLRRTLQNGSKRTDEESTTPYIETLPKRGYRFVAPVSERRAEIADEPNDLVDSAMERQLSSGNALHTRANGVDYTTELRRAKWNLQLSLTALIILGAALVIAAAFVFSNRSHTATQTQVSNFPPTGNAEKSEAQQLYERGRFFWNKRTDNGLKKSVQLFKEAIAADPNHARSYAGLADNYAFEAYQTNQWRKGEELAQKAIELDPTLAEPHASLGFIDMFHEWNWAAAETEFKRAIELDAGYATAHQWYSILLQTEERFDEAKSEIDRALECDPVSLPINSDMAEFYFYTRQYDQTLEQTAKTFEMDANFPPARFIADRAYGRKGIFKLERKDDSGMLTLRCMNNTPSSATAMRAAYEAAGCRQALQSGIDFGSMTPSRSSYIAAQMYASLGDNQTALRSLETAYAEHQFSLVWVKIDPIFDDLHSEPRFKELLRRMNFQTE